MFPGVILGGLPDALAQEDPKFALLDACKLMLMSMGMRLEPHQEEEFCRHLLNFVHIAMEYNPDEGEDYEDY